MRVNGNVYAGVGCTVARRYVEPNRFSGRKGTRLVR
jgi:hypothetical protein